MLSRLCFSPLTYKTSSIEASLPTRLVPAILLFDGLQSQHIHNLYILVLEYVFISLCKHPLSKYQYIIFHCVANHISSLDAFPLRLLIRGWKLHVFSSDHNSFLLFLQSFSLVVPCWARFVLIWSDWVYKWVFCHKKWVELWPIFIFQF